VTAQNDVHTDPSASEIIQAAREFLEQHQGEFTSQRTRFHAKVTINALAMVQRELDAGTGATSHYIAERSALGYESEVDLALAIRDGRVATDDPAVRSLLEEGARLRIAVVNPAELGA
jgi:hypothetical protein